MRLIQDQPGYNWRTDDPAKMYFRHTGVDAAPTQLLANRIGHFCVNAFTQIIPVEIERLHYMASAMFGPGRGGNTKWTGDAYKFAIYRYNRDVVILRTDGGGTTAYLVDQLDAIPTWRYICDQLLEPALWDICIMLTETFHAGEAKARTEERLAFAEGRMKKRRLGGKVRVEVVQKQA